MQNLELSKITVRRMKFHEIPRVVEIHLKAFLNDNSSKEQATQWITSLYGAQPVYHYFVSDNGSEVLGYVNYRFLGGFSGGNPERLSILELEQIGVDSRFQGMGVGTILARESFKQMIKHVRVIGKGIKDLYVTTGISNDAQK